MKIQTRLKHIVVFAALIGVLVSCTGIPVPEPKSDKQAILVIPMEYSDEAPGTFFADYLIYAYRTDVSSNLPFTIEAKTGSAYTVYRMLPPVTNRFSKILEMDKVSGDRLETFTLKDINFELQGGKINILPYALTVRLVPSTVPGEKRKPVQKVSFKPLSTSQYRDLFAVLTERDIDPSLIVLGKIQGTDR